jgi:spermidine/putrescine transport system ATP-binding protein
VRPEHSFLSKAAAAKTNSIPVEIGEVAFEGNFLNIFAKDKLGATHMVQSQNDPNVAPPIRGAKMHMYFPAEQAVVLANAKTNSQT